MPYSTGGRPPVRSTSEGRLEDYHERAALLEYDHDVPRADAEAQAAREILHVAAQGTSALPAMLDELLHAERTRLAPEVAAWVEEVGLAQVRAPMWGVDRILVDGDAYWPASESDVGRAGVIVPVVDDEGLADLVACDITTRRMYSRLGAATLIGGDAVGTARETGDPLHVFDHTVAWLRGHTRGAVILDLFHLGRALEGVRLIRCSVNLAPRLQAAISQYCPVPVLEVPVVERNAA